MAALRRPDSVNDSLASGGAASRELTHPERSPIPSLILPATPHRHLIFHTYYTCYIFIKQTFILARLDTSSLAEGKHYRSSSSADDGVKNLEKGFVW
ncbi:hypothetical protein E2C01_065021 [Portunus trituberculatus]|uniref:Uncharacterized protein n=1 Tax=Portunus trituberculatus TaxID=210409 RepID=A0A5B7HQL6_PORTR|nr:hypothetical protein [Portunus trituberculatus]